MSNITNHVEGTTENKNEYSTVLKFLEIEISHVQLLYLLTFLLTPCSRVLPQKLTGFQLVKKFPAFYGTRWFITAFTSARHLFLSSASKIQSMPPHPTSWRSILISPSHLGLNLPSGLFPSGFPIKILHTNLLSPIRATRHANFNLITGIKLSEEHRSRSSSLCSFLHCPKPCPITRTNTKLT